MRDKFKRFIVCFVGGGMLFSASARERDLPTVHDDILLGTVEETLLLNDIRLNDEGVDGAPVAVTKLGKPQNGTILVKDNEAWYKPMPGFAGKDTFEYSIKSGGKTASGTVRVVISKDVDKSGWEALQSVVPDTLYFGKQRMLGTLSVFGPNARVLANYDAECAAPPAKKKDPNNPEVRHRFGAFASVATYGKGRVVTIASQQWFTGMNKKTLSSDKKFIDAVIDWLSDGRKADLVTNLPNVCGVLKGQLVNGQDAERLKKQLAKASVYVGTFDTLSEAQVDVISEFVLNGGAVFTGQIGRTFEDKGKLSASFSVHPDTVHFPRDLNHAVNVNRFLRLGGTGVGYYVYAGFSDSKVLSTSIPIQWPAAYPNLMDAVDDFNHVKKGAKNLPVAEDFVSKGEDPVRSVANMIAGQLVSLTECLPYHDILRAKLDQKLELLQPAQKINDPMQMALLWHEGENNFKQVKDRRIDLVKKSGFADYWSKVPDDAPRVKEREYRLEWYRQHLQPLGLYAAPGEVITLDFTKAPDMVGKELSVRIGAYRMAEFCGVEEWPRAPLMEVAVPVDKPIVYIASAYGGDVFIDYLPDNMEAVAGNPRFSVDDSNSSVRPLPEDVRRHKGFSWRPQFVTVSGGAVDSPMFVLGRDTVDDWNKRIRHLPGRSVIYSSEYVMMVQPREVIDTLGIYDLEWLLAAQDRGIMIEARLGGRTPFYPFPYILEPHNLWKASAGGRGYGAHPPLNPDGSMHENFSQEFNVSHRHGYVMHESAHQWWASVARIGSGAGEIDPYSMDPLMLREMGLSQPGPESWVCIDTKRVPYDQTSPKAIFKILDLYFDQGYDFPYREICNEASDPKQVHHSGHMVLPFWVALMTSRFGEQTGWDVMEQVMTHRSYAKFMKEIGTPDPKKSFPETKSWQLQAEDFAINWARYSGYDLSVYMEKLWGFTLPEPVKNEIRKLSKDKHVWLPLASELENGNVLVQQNTPLKLDLAEETVAINSQGNLVGAADIKLVEQPMHGKITVSNGKWVYVPEKGYAGRDRFTYSAAHPSWKKQPPETYEVRITVAARSELTDIKTAVKQYGPGASVENWRDKIDIQSLHRGNEAMPASWSYRSFQGMSSAWTADLGPSQSVRMRAYLVPPKSGYYTFVLQRIQARGEVAVWLNKSGTDSKSAEKIIDDANLKYIGRWGRDGSSKPIKLTAGERYYIETVGGPSQFNRVGWVCGDQPKNVDYSKVQLISNNHLIPYIVPRTFLPTPDVVAIANPAKTESERPSYMIDVLSNDKDYVNQDPSDLSFINMEYVSSGRNGTVEIIGSKIRYTPNAGFTGSERIIYFAQPADQRIWAEKGVLTIHVGQPAPGENLKAELLPENKPPVAMEDSASGKSVVIDVLANDRDPDGNDTLRITDFTQPAKGTVTFSFDGFRLEYAGPGNESFKYTVSDGRGGQAVGTVRIK